MKFCIDDKDVKDDNDGKDDNDIENDNNDNDDEYNDVNEHLVKLDIDKTDQSNESMITNLTFEALFAQWDKGRTNFSGGDSGIQQHA